jgi:hypothetical protein
MTENEKRAEALSWGCESVYRATSEMQIATALADAERRGEERVLRWMDRVRASAWIDGAHRPVVSEYRKARRARVGRRK